MEKNAVVPPFIDSFCELWTDLTKDDDDMYGRAMSTGELYGEYTTFLSTLSLTKDVEKASTKEHFVRLVSGN